MADTPVFVAEHPRGSAGSAISVAKTVNAAAIGRINRVTIAIARRWLTEAGRPSSRKDQAEALLDRQRKEKWFIPDPVDAEMVVVPQCLLAECDGIELDAGDCDDLTATYVALVSSVGIPAAVVGQAFDQARSIGHVLAAVEVAPGVWMYADPSDTLPFGQANTPTREVWYAVPSGKQLCDRSPSCHDFMQGKRAVTSDRKAGDFVGIGIGQTIENGGVEAHHALPWWQTLGLLVLGVSAAYGIYKLGEAHLE